MNVEQLERFVMDTIDTYANNPKEYSLEAVKSIIADRFEIHRRSIQGKAPTFNMDDDEGYEEL